MNRDVPIVFTEPRTAIHLQETGSAPLGELPAGRKPAAGIRAIILWLTSVGYLAPSDSLLQRFLAGTLWSGVASAASQLPSMAVSVLLGRTLGLTTFGRLATIQSMVLMLSTLGDLGLAQGITRYVAAHRSSPLRASRAVGFSLFGVLLCGSVISAVILWSAPWFATNILHVPDLGVYLQFATVFLFFELLNRIQLSILIGLEAFSATAVVNALRGFLLLCAPAAAYAYGLAGALLALTCTSAAACAVAHKMLSRASAKRGISTRLCFRNPDPKLLHMAASLWFSLLIVNTTFWFATVILVRQPAGVAEMALFTAADKWKTALVFLPTVLAQVITPFIAHAHASGNRTACARLLVASSALCGAVTALLATAMILSAHFLMSTYGWARKDAGEVLIYACLGCVPTALYSLGNATCWAMGRLKSMVALDLLRSLFLISFVLAGFGRYARLLAAAQGLSIVVPGLLLLALLRNMLRSPQIEDARVQ